MKIINAKKIDGLKIIENIPTFFKDHRGSYLEIYNKPLYDDIIGIDFLQDTISISNKGVLRGFHGDSFTYKLFTCLLGSIMMVIVDADKNSSTYGSTDSFILTEDLDIQILVPTLKGTAFQVISDKAVLSYKQSSLYKGQDKQFTIPWDDKKLNIQWPLNPILSDRDKDVKTWQW